MFHATELADMKRHYKENPLRPSCLTLLQYNTRIRTITMSIENLLSDTRSLRVQSFDFYYIFYRYSFHNKYLFLDAVNRVFNDVDLEEFGHLQVLLDNSKFLF